MSAIFNSKGRLSQTDYAYKTATINDLMVAMKSKYLKNYFDFQSDFKEPLT